MLGTRGVRLGLIHPEIYEMQVRAIFRAVRAVQERTGRAPRVEIMVPLVAYARELEIARKMILAVAVEEGFPHGHGFQLGTMIELPRACFRAGEIARFAEFFSFGTNDLTQTGLGFSRDDIEALVVPLYQDLRHPRALAVPDDRREGRRRAGAARRRRTVAPSARASSSGSAASTAATRSRSASSTRSAWTTSAARPSVSRSPAWRPPRPRSRASTRTHSAPGEEQDAPPPPSRAGAAVSYFLILKVTLIGLSFTVTTPRRRNFAAAACARRGRAERSSAIVAVPAAGMVRTNVTPRAREGNGRRRPRPCHCGARTDGEAVVFLGSARISLDSPPCVGL